MNINEFYEMGIVMNYVGVGLTLSCPKRLKLMSLESRVRCSSEVGVSRRQLLEQVDKELSNGDDRAALLLGKDLQGKPGGLRCFGAARQVLCFLNRFFFSFFWVLNF